MTGVILAALMGALGRRVAGGAFQQWTGLDIGDYPVRAFFGLTIALSALIAGLWWPYALACVPAVFLGCSCPNKFKLGKLGEFGGIDMGHSDKLPLWRGVLGLTVHGVLGFVGVTVGAAVLHLGWFTVLVGSALIAPLYGVGWVAVGGFVPGFKASLPVGFKGGSELGEALWGAAVAVAVYLAVAL